MMNSILEESVNAQPLQTVPQLLLVKLIILYVVLEKDVVLTIGLIEETLKFKEQIIHVSLTSTVGCKMLGSREQITGLLIHTQLTSHALHHHR